MRRKMRRERRRNLEDEDEEEVEAGEEEEFTANGSLIQGKEQRMARRRRGRSLTIFI